MTDPILSLDACSLIAGVRDGALSHRAVAEAYLDRIATKEESVGAFIFHDSAMVRDAADALDLAGTRGALAGLPVGVKDVIDTCDMPTGYGSALYGATQPVWDAPCVTQSRQAGALMMGKTVSTEFAMASPGKTRNPWNTAHTPGGSSSGSCAAVASGMALMGFGTQTAGSIIRPASYCGVVGYKPSFGLLDPSEIKVLSHSLDTLGVVTRRVADAALVAAILGGRPGLALKGLPDTAPRIGVFRTPPFNTEAATDAALDHAIRALGAAGARVTDITPPTDFGSTHGLHAAIMGWEVSRALSHERLVLGDRLTEVTRAFLAEKARVTVEEYDAARRALPAVHQSLSQAMAEVDILLAPSAPGTAPKGLEATGSPEFNTPWTVLHMPALTLPAILSDGLPVGVQIIGRIGEDAATLRAAAWVERCLEAPKVAP
ncbi:amidase [Pseudooceanicola algae]|uniref:Amidase AmiD n=1 Tax=Pseudooceanicola algae TaxID=1537215 RepID=A0A418SIU8_9RHOB|nr:amidase [Pseudooceanicola algae]QPM91175.1 Putative amidase AmiD [Pseudooceanicola algae]